MKVAEIFYSVQGEINVGKPSVFVRLSGCNLIQSGKGCPWCDTKYAEKGEDRTLEQIAEEVLSYPCRNLVITGGEPLCQAEEVFDLLHELCKRDPNFDIPSKSSLEIETNGTIDHHLLGSFDFVNCSPKKQAINLEVLKLIRGVNAHTRFKFVYENDKELWWEDIVNELNIPKSRVWIMPQGISREEQLARSPEVIEYCKKTGFNFTPRLHILVWDLKRGV